MGSRRPAASSNTTQDMLAETRRRMAGIDRHLDTIPLQYYYAFDHPMVKQASLNLDPALAKPTSKWIIEATRAAAAEGAAATSGGQAAASGSSKGGKGRKNKKRRIDGAGNAAAENDSAGPKSRGDLHERLEARLSELREERRRRQSAEDKKKAEQAKKREGPTGRLPPALVEAAKPAVAKTSESANMDSVEVAQVGRLNFDVKAANLPFEASVGRKGAKVKKLRAELRKTEMESERLRKAEAAGHGEEARRDIAMEKALKRARGEKVHDDSTKLRKAQKQLELKRKRGKDKFEERKEASNQESAKIQKERKENLQNRPSKNKNKQKLRLGFEGNKTGFLNSGG